MGEIDPITGLPKELGTWESITKESQRITVKLEKRKFRKVYTLIEGIDLKQLDAKDLLKKLKNKFACGGTIKEGRIELQGDHKSRAKEALTKLGFAPETIDLV